MPMTLSGNGTITGLVAGGLPDGTITGSDLASGAAGSNLAGSTIPGSLTMTGTVTGNQFKNSYTTALSDFRTTSPAADTIILQGSPGDRDCWIYRDPAGGTANWGIYHRQIDTDLSTGQGALPHNSIAFVGNTALAGYIELGVGGSPRWGIGANLVPVSSQGVPTGSVATAAQILWFPAWHSELQRVTHDRSWENYPSISVHNTTDKGPQGQFRIHGTGGVNGGDFSVELRVDGPVTGSSDARRKTNIETISNALQKVSQLRGVTYNVLSSNGEIDPYLKQKVFGFLGQEALPIIPEAVKHSPDVDEPNEHGWANAYSIDYASIVALLTEAIKEQQAQIESLKVEINTLKGV